MATDKMYESAFRYKQTKLWKNMLDTEIFAVRLSDGEIGYCCVMGLLGEHISLALYVGDEGFQSFRELAFRKSDFDFAEPDFASMMDASWALRQVCLQCSFENRDELTEWDAEEVRRYARAHKIQLRGAHSFPNFSKYARYRMPSEIDAPEDERRICEALDAATALAELLKTKSKADIGLLPVDEDTETLPLLIPGKNGYTVTSAKVPEPWEETYPEPAETDEERVAELRKLRKKGVYACEIIRLPGMLGDEDQYDEDDEEDEYEYEYDEDEEEYDEDEDDEDEDEEEYDDDAPFFPAILLCVDVKSGTPVATHPVADYENHPEALRDAFIQTLIDNGVCPRAIKARDEQARVLLSDLCMKAGILLSVDNEIPALDEAKAELMGMLQMGGGLFDDEDEDDGDDAPDMDEAISFVMDEMMRMSDRELKTLPREVARQILDMAPFGFVPKELQLRLRRLFK